MSLVHTGRECLAQMNGNKNGAERRAMEFEYRNYLSYKRFFKWTQVIFDSLHLRIALLRQRQKYRT
jgi:hypothetical protein